MLRSVKSLEGYVINAMDGSIGHLKTLHFDDKSWGIKYLVVNVGSFFESIDVLILPTAAYELSWAGHDIKVNLTQQQIKESKPFSADLPISVRHELLNRLNFNSLYLIEPWSGSVLPLWFPTSHKESELITEVGDTDLHCCKMVEGYSIRCTDKKIGNVVDFVIDDNESETGIWRIRYIVVDTNGILPAGKILLPTRDVVNIDSDNETVQVVLSSDELKHCPEYDSTKPVNREYEVKYFDYEGRLRESSYVNVKEYFELDERLSPTD